MLLFLGNMKIAATQVFILYVMIFVGFLCCKAKIFTEKAARLTTDLLFYIVTVSVIINSFMSMKLSEDTAKHFIISFLCNTATFIIAIVMTLPMFKKEKDERNPIFKFASIYGNCGYMALPLAQAILGDEGVFYCSTGVIVFNILCFTHGVKLMTKDEYKFGLKKLILNPGTLGVLIGLPLFITGLELPEIISKPVTSFASMNTPLAMLMFGAYLANTDLKTLFTEKKVYLTALIKLMILPLICVSLYRLCGVSGTLLTACAITAAAPSANNTIMLSAKYDRDTGTASKTVALVSLISIFTMPVMIALSQSI